MAGPEKGMELGALIFLAAIFVAIYRLSRWIMECPATSNPWGNEIEESLNRWEALPLCDKCLTPQEHDGWFCPECGSTFGAYCNYLPYVVIFSQGQILRSGTMQPLRKNGPLIMLGYILFAFGTMAALAPVYWIFLCINWVRGATPHNESDQSQT